MDPVILSTRSFEETGNLLSIYLVKFSGALDPLNCEAESFSLFEKYDYTHYIIDWLNFRDFLEFSATLLI